MYISIDQPFTVIAFAALYLVALAIKLAALAVSKIGQ